MDCSIDNNVNLSSTNVSIGNTTVYYGPSWSSTKKCAEAIWHVVKAIFAGVIKAPFDRGTYFQNEIALAKKCFSEVRWKIVTSTDTPETQKRVIGSGTVVEQVRKIAAKQINALDVNVPFDVTLTRGQEAAITISADDNIVDLIKSDVVGGRLTLALDGLIQTQNKVKIAISLPDLPDIALSGCGSLKTADDWKINVLKLEMSGSGDVTIAKLVGKKLLTIIRGSGNLHIQSGEVDAHNFIVSGSGRCNASGLSSKTATITLTGSGSAEVNVSEHMNVLSSGTGNVYYRGNPSISKSETGTGRVYSQ